MSNNNGLSYTQIVDRMEAFANGHFMINAFQHGLIDLIDVPKDQLYPVMHFVPGTIQPTLGGLAYQFEVVFYDLPRAKEVENEYQREVISDMARLALDLISEIKNGNVLFDSSVDMDGDPVITAFVESYSQVVTGVTLQMSLIVPYNWNACEIPADYAVGGSGSGGSGSGRGGITLKVNGTNNAVQNVLDLVQGTNVIIEDLGDGRVRIRATGGGGGSVDWGSIGGTLSEQTDLQTALDGKASDGELTTEVNARIAADTNLQNNINTLDGELSTETTARQAGDATNAADLTAHTSNTNNPHNTTKAQVGLGNADNTSDAEKPVSSAQATAIGAKQDTLVSGTNIKTINGNSILGAGNLVISAAVNQAFRTFSTSFTLAASSGDRWYVMQNGLSSGTEAAVQASAEFAMTFTEIRVRTVSTQSATGSLVFTLRKNGVDQFSLTIAAGATAGVYTATGSFSVVAGDLINWKIRNNATATSANIAQLSATYQ